MTDVAAISGALTAIKTATEIAKLLRESDRSLEKAEMKLKLADLVSALADAKIQIAEFHELVDQRDARIAELEESFAERDSVVRHADAYYRRNNDGQPTGDPLCLRCWAADHKQRPLVTTPDYRVKKCPFCNTIYDSALTKRLPAP